MLVRSASAVNRRCTPEENVTLKHSKSVRGLVNSTSSRRKYVKNGIPPVPPLPKNIEDIQPVTPVPPLPNYIEQIVPKNTEQVIKEQQPVAKEMEPVMTKERLVFKEIEPVVYREDPVVKEVEQEVSKEEPATKKTEPAVHREQYITKKTEETIPLNGEHTLQQKEAKPKEDYKREEANRSPIKTLNTRIYIDDANNHVTLQLNPLLTSGMVIQYLKKKSILDSSTDWTLFEFASSHQVERPLREWEYVLDTVGTWDPDETNALLIKKYMFHYTLTSETIFQKSIQSMHGWLSIEYKKGKWQKRYCFIKDNAIHHAKDKGAPSSVLCHLASYDVYTLLQPLKISPTPFVFSIRAQNRASIFEKEGDYIRFMATEDSEEMKHWVLSIRQSKSIIQYQQSPQRVAHPFVLEGKKEETPLRRQKSIKTLTPSRSESTSRTEPKTKTKGLSRSPTVKETEESRVNEEPLIQIDDKVKFAKGSLLAKKMPEMMKRSKSMREVPVERAPETRRHVSLRRRPTVKKASDAVPLPSNSNTLLQLDDSPESFHSKELRGRHVKPLLHFDPPSPSTRR
ncbi:hypothetical protein CU098_004565 [Rhizopus stolonifer]|uniref:PH domain-containing protein n=1 Tax=Rhizopus stolonifer TaxID=4846 RepID=A0A367J0R5_RHIST|nr:hypothetical protein CU098_004565 [Rhizopus stolonifer]